MGREEPSGGADRRGSGVRRGGFGRRRFLAGAAAVAGGYAVRPDAAWSAPKPKGPVAAGDAVWQHARDPRGIDIAAVRGRLEEGRFGVMFKRLPAFAPEDEALRSLAAKMADLPETWTDTRDNVAMPMGLVFFGQFLDHDLTLDRTPLSQQVADPHAVRNFLKPSLRLDSVYGDGPASHPELYEADGVHLKVLTNAHGVLDLPRDASGRALMGDGRNDENLVTSQLHCAFVLFHNRLVDAGAGLAEARRLTAWHFQWLVVHDFLTRVAGRDVVDRLLVQRGGAPAGVRTRFYKPKNPHRPMMPIEFSAGAFRFAHSMLRSQYVISGDPPAGAPTVSAVLFGPTATEGNLNGSRPMPAALKIDWRHFVEVPGAGRPVTNPARLIDRYVSLPLHHMPGSVVTDEANLAARNLLRGKRVGVPAGQDVAREMGVAPLTNDELGGAAWGLDAPEWGGRAPLWFYVLAESELLAGGTVLGPVGAGIVAETILGILDRDTQSYLRSRFVPAPPVAPQVGRFGLGDLLRFAGVA